MADKKSSIFSLENKPKKKMQITVDSKVFTFFKAATSFNNESMTRAIERFMTEYARESLEVTKDIISVKEDV